MVAAAVIGAGVVAAGASAYAGHEAAGATRDASNAAVSEQRDALAQQATLSQPYRDLGSAAIPKYEALLGLGPQGDAGIKAALESMPGYQFAKEQGTAGIANLASTQGGISGNTLADLAKFNTGLADSTYQSELADVGGAVASGQAAAAGQAQNVGTAAGNIGNTLINQGNNQANITAGTIAGITKAGSNAVDQYTTLSTLQALNSQAGANNASVSGGQLWS